MIKKGGVYFMNNQTYVCLGSCQAHISEKEYKNGLTTCGNNACENKGKPFVKGGKCPHCGRNYKEGEEHQH